MKRSTKKKHKQSNNKILMASFFLLILIFISIGFFTVKNNEQKTYPKRDEAVDESSKKDIVVLGSEPEAITAAVINSRLGNNVHLITEDKKLGGLFTEGMLTAFDINYYPNKKILHEGFFTEFYNNASNGYNLDLKKTQEFFDDIVEKENIKVVKNVKNIKPIVDENEKVKGVYYEKDNKGFKVNADFVFDGSYEAEFTRKLGAKYRTGRSEFGKHDEYAAAGLMFSVKGVDWDKMTKVIKNDDDPETGVNKNAAWGFKEMYDYIPKNDMFKMRGLNISRQDDGSIILNALLVIGVDPLDENSYAEVVSKSKEEIPLIIDYMKKNLKGFENASLGEIAEHLYIREGVRIIGEETLDGYDIIAHSEFDDVIGYGSYPADLQTSTKENYGNALNGNSVYEIPLGIMMPKGIDNVLVLGRCASFDIVAHSSARTVPVLMSMAQGASYAVDYALKNNLTLSEVRENHMEEVHKIMEKDGNMNLPKMPENKYKDSNSIEYIKHLRQKGLITTKYFGTLPFNEKANYDQIKSIVNLSREYTQINFTDQQIESIRVLSGEVKKEDLHILISILVNKKYDSLEQIKNEGIISQKVYDRIKNSSKLLNDDLYAIMSDYIKYMQKDFRELVNVEDKDIIIEQ